MILKTEMGFDHKKQMLVSYTMKSLPFLPFSSPSLLSVSFSLFCFMNGGRNGSRKMEAFSLNKDWPTLNPWIKSDPLPVFVHPMS